MIIAFVMVTYTRKTLHKFLQKQFNGLFDVINNTTLVLYTRFPDSNNYGNQ